MTGKIALQDIVNAICQRYSVTENEMRGPLKHRRIVRPRQIAMHLARDMTGLSLHQIGAYFSRDHSTVCHAQRTILALIEIKPKVAAAVSECRALVTPRHKENVRAMAAQPLVTEAKAQPRGQ